jgi:maltose/moltooligosaccharide transporter
MKDKLLTTQNLFDLAVCAFGIQFASSLMMANMSSIYKFFGAEGGDLPYLWLAAPISGLLIQPIIGQLSDDTLTRYGKRRPYLFFWGLITFICFSLIPLARNLWLMVILFWGIGCGINGMTEALRALIGDITANQQKTQAFSWQTIFAGIGATIAAVLPYLLSKSDFLSTYCRRLFNCGHIPFSIQLAFILGGVVLAACVLWTLYRIKEKSISRIEAVRKRHQHHQATIKKIKYLFPQLILSIKKLPLVLRQFLIIQVFTWIGLYSMWLYFTLAIAQHVYGLPMSAHAMQDPNYAIILEKSTIRTGIYFGAYQFVSILYAMWLPILANRISPKLIHAVSLIIGAVGLMIVVVARVEVVIIFGVIAIGIMWGSIMTMPYAIVTAGMPRGKMGVYLGIFNITITVPQIICGLFLGFIYTVFFKGHAIYCLLLAGVSILIAGILLARQFSRDSNLLLKAA